MMNIPYKPYREQYRVVASRQFNGDSSKKKSRTIVVPDDDTSATDANAEALIGDIHNPIDHPYRVVAKSFVYDLRAALSPIIRRASLNDTDQPAYDCLSELVFFYVHAQPLKRNDLTSTQITEIIQLMFSSHMPVNPVIQALFRGLHKKNSINGHYFQSLVMSIVSASSDLPTNTIYAVVQYVLQAVAALHIKKKSDKERLLRHIASKTVRYYLKKRANAVPVVLESIIQTTVGFMDRTCLEAASVHQLCGMIRLFVGKPKGINVRTQELVTTVVHMPDQPSDSQTQSTLKLAWQSYYSAEHPSRRMQTDSGVATDTDTGQPVERWLQCLSILSQTPQLNAWAIQWRSAFTQEKD